jgi:hypothetical protein
MRRASFILLMCAIALCVNGIEQAHACTCAAPATTAKALKRATAVFRGRVVKISIPSSDRIGLTHTGAHRVKFQILKQWKGPTSETSVVVTRLSAEGCGFPFEEEEEEKEYLVYVVAEPRQIQTGICTGTKSIAEAEQEMKELDEIVADIKR